MLTYVAENGPMRASEIAEQFDIDKGAISRQVTHLTELGLLARVTDPDDGRAMLVSVSDEGRTPADRRGPAPSQVARRAARRLGREDLTGFVAALGRYNRALDA